LFFHTQPGAGQLFPRETSFSRAKRISTGANSSPPAASAAKIASSAESNTSGPGCALAQAANKKQTIEIRMGFMHQIPDKYLLIMT
jgi:hypothetical protein